jgi:GNAT superfamily N-acetyltransferase
MSHPSIVRRAGPEDRDGVWKLFDLLYDENAMFQRSDRKIDYLLDRILDYDRIDPTDGGLRGFMGVIGPVGDLEGFILLVLSSYWYSEDIMLEEYANFVHPEHRKSNHAKTLIGYARNLADRVNVPLSIGIVSNVRTAAKIRLYRRHLPEAGSFFLYNAVPPKLNGRNH